MKHAGASALDRLEPLLRDLRNLPALREKSRGIFYCGGRAFLHFHEHGEELFADLRAGDEFERHCATTAKDRIAVGRKVNAALKKLRPTIKARNSVKKSG